MQKLYIIVFEVKDKIASHLVLIMKKKNQYLFFVLFKNINKYILRSLVKNIR